MKPNYEILVRPLITEKSMKLVDEGQYTFEVKKAVEELFKVDVTAINMMNTQRKRRRVGKYEGLRPAVQKAIVTLAEGQKLDVFEI